MTQNNGGAIPSISGGEETKEVLGTPKGTTKNKSNVTRLFYVIGFVAAGLFIIVGVLFFVSRYQKNHSANTPAAPVAKKSTLANKNAEVKNDNIDDLKKKLKKQDDEAQASAAATAATSGNANMGYTPGAATGAVNASGVAGSYVPPVAMMPAGMQLVAIPCAGGVAPPGAKTGAGAGAGGSVPVNYQLANKAAGNSQQNATCFAMLPVGPTLRQRRQAGDVLALNGLPAGSLDNGQQQGQQQPKQPASGGGIYNPPANQPVAGQSARPLQQASYNPSAPSYGSQYNLAPSASGNKASPESNALSSSLSPTELKSAKAGHLGNLTFMLKKGTTIPCALKTGIDTTLPGFIVCTAIRDVYSANSKVLLIERGAQIFGEQRSSVQQGQARVFALWTRIDNPSGVTAELDSPGTDQMGYSGLPGFVDTHFWDRFGGAIMMSVINDALATAMLKAANAANAQQIQISNTEKNSQTMGQEALKASINIPPTVTVLPATVVNVMVARDISFDHIYKVVK